MKVSKKSAEFVGYIRVSTLRQEQEGFGLDIQEQVIKSWVTQAQRSHRWIFSDAATARSLRSFQGRAGLQDALKMCRDLGVDLVVPNISRLSRDMSILRELDLAGVKIISVLDGGRKVSKPILHAIIKKAELEGANIAKRTKDALAVAKSRGVILGNKSTLEAAQRRGSISNVVRSGIKIQELADFLEKNANWQDLSRLKLVDLLNASGPLNLISEKRLQREPWRISTLREPLAKAIKEIAARTREDNYDLQDLAGAEILEVETLSEPAYRPPKSEEEHQRMIEGIKDHPNFNKFS